MPASTPRRLVDLVLCTLTTTLLLVVIAPAIARAQATQAIINNYGVRILDSYKSLC